MAREQENGRERSREEDEEREAEGKSGHQGEKGDDLPEREYTDAEGETRHHTRKYLEEREEQ